MPANYLILSLDGGGIRGLLAGLVLQRLQAELKMLDRVRLLAGTSTGGILALGLAGKVPVDKLVGLYKDEGKAIFQRYEPGGLDALVLKPVELLVDKSDRLKGLGIFVRELLNVKYTNQGLQKVVRSVFPTDPTLQSLNPDRHVLVTTFCLSPDGDSSWRPIALHNLPTPGNRPEDTHVVEASLCTSAAPMYFPPYRHRTLGWCIDGGIFANSPGSVALATAIEARIEGPTIRMLSVGTGGTVSRMQVPSVPVFRNPEDYGIGAWLAPAPRDKTPAFPLISALFEATSLTDQLVCQQILGPTRYRRIQVPLPKPLEMDDWTQTGQLEKIADDYFKQPAWSEHLKWVKENFA